ncbi:uncharacterized protein STEHIDRAFT_50135, partial [Stereum hirsutum FP-91666 SS1]|uniref:uncharacterized protein n=1 Tax=Stereum hirsutum (strain FP-91666) TaxID=721885 RepID=UPI000440A2B6
YGNMYRGCGHYVILYRTGNRTDCMSPNCALSSQHQHRAVRYCNCSRHTNNSPQRVVNLFQTQCDLCQEADFHDRGRRR